MPVTGESKNEISFTVAEATKQLGSDLSANHGVNISAIGKRMDPNEGGSRLADIRSGESTLGDVLADEDDKKDLRDEVLYKMHNLAQLQLKDAAKNKQISSLDEVSQLADVIVRQTDDIMTNLEQAHVAIQQARTPEQRQKIVDALEGNFAKAWGEEDVKPDKRSLAFQSTWNTFRKALTK